MIKEIGLAIVFCSSLAAQSKIPERKVEGNVISSEGEPRVRIELPASVQYLGADRWVLYGFADCELHAFVDADRERNVQRLYWVQFEGYLPTKPNLHHTYDSPRHVNLGGMDFYVDSWARASNAPIESGSDREHIETLMRSKGYKMPAGMMYVRLVHLLDKEKRKELMIIYGEGLDPAELRKGSKRHDQWRVVESELIERATKKVAIQRTAEP